MLIWSTCLLIAFNFTSIHFVDYNLIYFSSLWVLPEMFRSWLEFALIIEKQANSFKWYCLPHFKVENKVFMGDGKIICPVFVYCYFSRSRKYINISRKLTIYLFSLKRKIGRNSVWSVLKIHFSSLRLFLALWFVAFEYWTIQKVTAFSGPC